MLNRYLTRTTRLLGPSGAQFNAQSALVDYINEARGQVAAEGQCIKVLPPGTNGIASISVTAGGSGYLTAPTVVITGPGSGATATANLVGNAVSTVTVNTAGSGYDNTTTITFTGGGGTLAAASPVINCVNTVAAQEIYTFASVNPLAQLTAGVASVLFVSSVAVSWGALKPTLRQINWDDLQAWLRSYPIISGQPAVFAQFGQGESGSIYLQPVPTQAASMEWNCVCTPIDLVDDTTVEAIPYPWTDAVPYFAAYLALLTARRPIEAKGMRDIYDDTMKRSRSQSESSFVEDFYA